MLGFGIFGFSEDGLLGLCLCLYSYLCSGLCLLLLCLVDKEDLLLGLCLCFWVCNFWILIL